MNLIINYFNILFGVSVGILLSPIAYKVNRQSESKEAINNFYIELDDLIVPLKEKIIDTYSNFILCKNASADKLISIIRIEQLELLSLDEILSCSLKNLSFDQRRGIRQIKRLITMLNKMLIENEQKLNSSEVWKTSIRILSNLFSLSNQMSSKKGKYHYKENNTNKTTADVLQQVILQDKQYINEVSQETNRSS